MPFEAASFAAAALVHLGAHANGYEHQPAGAGESVIGMVPLVGFGLSWTDWASVRTLGLVAQAFALLGTLVGLFTIAIGVGPRTVPDLAYHLAIGAVLVLGLVVAARAPASASSRPG